MATFDLPSAPAVDDQYTANGVTYKWNGYGWVMLEGVPVALAQLQMGQCKLVMESASLLRLIPYNGNQIMIAGVLRTIPEAGVTLGLTGFVGQVLNYVYATWNGTTVVLERSTTAYQIINGLRIKIGDPSRTLVGMACSWTGSAFEPAMVRSWFNEDGISVFFTASEDQSLTTPNVWWEMPTPRGTFLAWANEQYIAILNANAYAPVWGEFCMIMIGLDGSGFGHAATHQQLSENFTFALSQAVSARIAAEGIRRVSVFANVSSTGGMVIRARSIVFDTRRL
jgi:hypothetical protein